MLSRRGPTTSWSPISCPTPCTLLAPLLAGLTRPGGAVVLAGILDEQAAAVASTYAQWFAMQVASEKDGWTCLAGARKR